eukprot:394250-Pyramimonas_sp.AAC.1
MGLPWAYHGLNEGLTRAYHGLTMGLTRAYQGLNKGLPDRSLSSAGLPMAELTQLAEDIAQAFAYLHPRV